MHIHIYVYAYNFIPIHQSLRCTDVNLQCLLKSTCKQVKKLEGIAPFDNFFYRKNI